MKVRITLMVLAILIVIAFLIFARNLPFRGDARTEQSSPATESTTSAPRVATTQTLPTDVQKKTLERRAIEREARRPKAERPRAQITNAEGRAVPELVVVAEEFSRRYAITGKLEERTRELSEGAGVKQQRDVHVVELLLRVEVRERGELVSVFSLRERGVGVTVDSARKQALTDLAWSLRRRLEPMP
jgi:hypothetical protein